MSPSLAGGLNQLQVPLNKKLGTDIAVKSIKQEFGEGARDEEWIPEAGADRSCIITQDYNINRIKHHREPCNEYQLGMFYLRPPTRGGFLYWDMVKLLVKTLATSDQDRNIGKPSL